MTPKLKLPLAFTLTACMLTPAIAQADDPGCDTPLVEIVAPQEGATLTGDPAEVTVEVKVEWGVALRTLSVTANGDEAGSMQISDNGTFGLPIELAPGFHMLQASAHDDCGGTGQSAAISVTVNPPAEGEDDDDGSGDHGDGSGDHEADGGSDGGDDGGCAVSRTPNRTIVGLSAFLLAVFGAWRLRRGESGEA